MKKIRGIWNLNRTILMIMMVGYCALLILLLCMDWYLIDEHQKNMRERERSLLEDSVANMEEAVDRVDKLIYDIYSFDSNFDRLGRSQTELEEYGDAYSLKETMRQKMTIEENLHGFYIFYGSGQNKAWYNVDTNYIKSEQSVELKETLRQRLEIDRSGSTIRNWMTVFNDQSEVCIAILCRKGNAALYGLYSLGRVESMILEGSQYRPEIMLVEDGMILKNSDMVKKLDLLNAMKGYSEEFSQRIRGYYVYGERIENTDLWIFTAYQAHFWQTLSIPQIFLLIITGLSMVAIAALYFFAKKQVIAPIRKLTVSMDAIRAGKTMEVPSIDARFYEIRKINETLAAMIQALEAQRKRTVEEAVEKERAQMQYLQLQLKPHFYLNGLKTLNALALEQDTGKMQELILNLSRHIRYLLQLDQETVTLSSEINFVENYVELQKHVTGRTVHCGIEADQEAMDWTVPVLCIQTFVENSIKYARLGSGCVPLEIQVKAQILQTEEGRFLDISVQDNGQGYPEEILEEINSGQTRGTRSVGIYNMKRRCRLLYGDRAEYSFANFDGALSELIIPEVTKNERAVGG